MRPPCRPQSPFPAGISASIERMRIQRPCANALPQRRCRRFFDRIASSSQCLIIERRLRRISRVRNHRKWTVADRRAFCLSPTLSTDKPGCIRMNVPVSGARRPRRATPVQHVAVGDLRHDASNLATDIQSAFVDGQHLVWAHEHHTVYVSRGQPPELPDHWIVGAYMMGISTPGIAQDLTALRKERLKDFIID
jgi:hypothetical protein